MAERMFLSQNHELKIKIKQSFDNKIGFFLTNLDDFIWKPLQELNRALYENVDISLF